MMITASASAIALPKELPSILSYPARAACERCHAGIACRTFASVSAWFFASSALICAFVLSLASPCTIYETPDGRRCIVTFANRGADALSPVPGR